jgi:predicted PurR-regulated permease PerM
LLQLNLVHDWNRMSLEPRRIDIPLRTFLKALVVVALAWVWLRLWQWLLIVVVAVFVAIALEPPVAWLTRRAMRRRFAAPLVMLLLVGALVGFIAVAGASLPEQARTVGQSLMAFHSRVMQATPEAFRGWLSSLQTSDFSITAFGRALIGGVAGFGVAIVLAVYLLIDGRRTYLWLSAFVPRPARARVHETAVESRDVVAAYVRGNLITSALATVATLVFLLALKVPAALFLALIAGIFNLLPVVGLLISAVPAVLLGLTVSPAVGVAVAAFYAGYNIVENYYIQPKVYGHEMQLSDIAVIIAFLVGAELGGVLGALVALPVAAIYPVVERIWLRDSRRADLPQTHAQIEAQCATES